MLLRMLHFILLLHALWSGLVLSLRNVSKLIDQYDCKEVCAPSPSQVNAGAGARLSSQDGVSQQQETVSLSLPQLNRLIEASFVRDESSASNADATVYLNVYDSRDGASEPAPSSLTHAHRCIGSRNPN